MKKIKLIIIYTAWSILIPFVLILSGMHYVVRFFGDITTTGIDYLEDKAEKAKRGG